MKVGFVGLGRMGRGMASNLLKNGVDLMVFDQVTDAVDQLVGAGAQAASDIAELTRSAEVIFLSLPGPAQVEEVIFGEAGIAANLSSGKCLIDLSTGSYKLAQRINETFKSAGCESLDAPISGGPAGAASGDLVVWAGGEPEIFEKYRDVLDKFSTPQHVGPIGAGTATKLAHNMSGFAIMGVMAEAFSLGAKAGLDPLDLLQALRHGVIGKKTALELVSDQFFIGDFSQASMTLELAQKDASLAAALGEELEVPLPLSNLVLQDLTRAKDSGQRLEDRSAFMKQQLQRAGVGIGLDPERVKQVRSGK